MESRARISWGVGEIIVILLSFASYLFKLTNGTYSLSLFLLLTGLWTLTAGLLLVDRRDRVYYSSWGVVLAVLSAFAFLPWNYTLGLVLVAIVILILLTAFGYLSGKMVTAATRPSPPAAGGKPAAS